MKLCRACRTKNENRFRNCQACGKKLPATRRPKHLVALKQPYEFYVVLNGADECAVCKRKPTATRRLDRDHDHATGEPRGLLCVRHNRMIDNRATSAEFRAVADYLDRHAQRMAA